MSSEIKSIIFDVDGTLMDFRKAEVQALEELRLFMGDTASPDEFITSYHRVNDRIWLELEQGLITGSVLKLERFRRFARERSSTIDPRELSEFYLTALGKGAFPLEGATELLQALKGRFPMAVVTNGLTKVQEARFKALAYDKIFDVLLISETEGVSKPDVEIFRRAAARMGVPLDASVLMVGDSLSSDIGGGIAAGIQTCWYNPGGWQNQSPHKADYEISHLSEILEIPGVQVQLTERLSR
ncbi:MAG: YjjG family noncanonical pyrimidine nucleotidase [Spirochaetales bacterium]|nr:YjjG family noncanonical pyrimidine nucleotidase [Spirochaetales bacterium]